MDIFGEWELARAAGIEGDMGAPGGVNLAGMPNPRKAKDPLVDVRRALAAQNARNRQQT